MTAENLRVEVYRTAEAYDTHGAQPVELAGGEIGVKMPAKRHSILCWLYWANGSGRYWRIEDEARVEPFRISARRLGPDAFPPALLLVRDVAAMAWGYLPLEPGAAVSSDRLRSRPKAASCK